MSESGNDGPDSNAAASTKKAQVVQAIDPKSFPWTTQTGLVAFLQALDGECPYSTAVESAPVAYQATGYAVPAGTQKEISFPITRKGWTAQLKLKLEDDGRNVGYNVRIIRSSHDDDADIASSPDIVVVEPGTMLNASSSSTEEKTAKKAPSISAWHGTHEFVIDSTPCTIVLTLDNTYSWFTPKTVSYQLQLTPPLDPKILLRSQRAKATMPLVQQLLSELKSRESESQSNVQTAHQTMESYQKKVQELQQMIQAQQQTIRVQTNQNETQQQKVKMMQESIEKVRLYLELQDEKISQLDEQIKILQNERERRVKEKAAFAQELVFHKGNLNLEQDNAQQQLESLREHQDQLQTSQQTVTATQKQVQQSSAEWKKAQQEEERLGLQMAAAQKLLLDLQLRITE